MGFGRFERKAASPPLSDINITPLVDVMLVLVVIFILTAPLLVSSIHVDLPRASGTAAGDAAPALSVAIDHAGQIFINDQPVGAVSMAAQFAQTARAQPATEVRLQADRTVPYGQLIEVMDAARQAGLLRIGFVTEPAPPSPGQGAAAAGLGKLAR